MNAQPTDRFLRSRFARFSEEVQEFIRSLLDQLGQFADDKHSVGSLNSDDRLATLLMKTVLLVDADEAHLPCAALAALPGAGELVLMTLASGNASGDGAPVAEEAYARLVADVPRHALELDQLFDSIETYPKLTVPRIADFVLQVVADHGVCAFKHWLPRLVSLLATDQQSNSASAPTPLNAVAGALQETALLSGASVAFALPQLAALRSTDIWLALQDCGNPDLDRELVEYLRRGTPHQVITAAQRIRELERKSLVTELHRSLAVQSAPDTQRAIALALIELGSDPGLAGSAVPLNWLPSLANARGTTATELLRRASMEARTTTDVPLALDTASELAWAQEPERWPYFASLLDSLPPSQALSVLADAPFAAWAAPDSALSDIMHRLLNEVAPADALAALSSPELTTRQLAERVSPWLNDSDAARRALGYRVCAPQGIPIDADRLGTDLEHTAASLRFAAIYALRCRRPEGGLQRLERRYWQLEDEVERAAVANALAYYRNSATTNALVDNLLRGGTALETYPSSPLVLFGPLFAAQPVAQALAEVFVAGRYTHETFASLIDLAAYLPSPRACELLREWRHADRLNGRDDVLLALALIANGTSDAQCETILAQAVSEPYFTRTPGRLWTWAQYIDHPTLVDGALAVLQSAGVPSAILADALTYLVSVEHAIPAVEEWICRCETKLVCTVLAAMAARPDLFTETDLQVLADCEAPTPYWCRQLTLARARAQRAMGDPSQLLALAPILIESLARAPYALAWPCDPCELPDSGELEQVLLRIVKRLPLPGEPEMRALQVAASKRLATSNPDAARAGLADSLPRLSIHGPLDTVLHLQTQLDGRDTGGNYDPPVEYNLYRGTNQ